MRKNKGFTLPETLLSLVILAVLVAIVGSTIIVSLNVLGRHVQLFRAQLAADGVCGYLEQRLGYGVDIMMTHDPDIVYTGSSPMMITVTENGRLLTGSCTDADRVVSVFDDGFYGDMDVEIYISRDIERADIIELYAEVYLDNELLCSASRTVKTMNCDAPVFAGVISNYTGNIYLFYSAIGGDMYEQPAEQIVS